MTTEKPVLYLSNWASRLTPGHHGRGRKLSIMVKTPFWAKPDGRVEVVAPAAKDLWAAREGGITFEQYRESYTKKVEVQLEYLKPGKLIFQSKQRLDSYEVKDGDTLCCACSKEKARESKCHRSWLAPVLVAAGWRVILDGKEVEG